MLRMLRSWLSPQVAPAGKSLLNMQKAVARMHFDSQIAIAALEKNPNITVSQSET